MLTVILAIGLALLLVGRFTSGETQVGSSPARTTDPVAPDHTRGASDSGTKLRVIEDKIANRPMPQGNGSNARQMEVNATTKPLKLPKPTKRIVGVVASGFPRTPAGAVAQLVALNQATLHNFDVDAGRRIYQKFTLPGAVSINQWNPTGSVLQYYQHNPDSDPAAMTATYTPTQGLIKGTADHGRFAVVCTLGRLTYADNGDSNTVGAPDCARMQWHDGRWMIAPGANPAPPPNTWPRSQTSYQAGFRDLAGWVPS